MDAEGGGGIGDRSNEIGLCATANKIGGPQLEVVNVERVRVGPADYKVCALGCLGSLDDAHFGRKGNDGVHVQSGNFVEADALGLDLIEARCNILELGLEGGDLFFGSHGVVGAEAPNRLFGFAVVGISRCEYALQPRVF